MSAAFMPDEAPNAASFRVENFKQRRSTLRDGFSTYRDTWAEILAHFRPRRGGHLKDAKTANGGKVDGRKMHKSVIQSTPVRVAKNAQSGLQAGVTSPSRPWKQLGPSDSSLNEVPGAREFYAETDRRLDWVLSRSNFYRSTHTAYADFVDCGPGAVQIDQHEQDVIRCQVHPLGSWVGACNADGRVDVFYRDYNPTGYEMIDRFGKDAMPGDLYTQIKKHPYKKYDLTNAIEPNPFYAGKDQPAIGLAAFKYVSVWWVKGYEESFVKVHGYHEFPVMVFRMSKSEDNDPYGYGAGFDGLGEAKQIMHQTRVKLKGLDKEGDPPLQAPTSLRKKGVSMVPGKITYIDGDAQVRNLFNMQIPYGEIRQDVAECAQRLSEIFFEDLFLMITRDVNRQVTAREIDERHEEKLVMLGPVLESINDEFLDPAIDRVLGIMRRAGLLPAAPPELEGVEFKIEYVSILAQAQRAVKSVPIEQGVNFVSGMVGAGWADASDRVNPDKTIDNYLENIGFPPEAIRSIRDSEGLREQRQAQIEQAQQNEQMAQIASAAGSIAPVADQIQPSVLQQLIGRAA